MSDAKALPHTGYVSAKQVREYFSISNSTLYAWLGGANRNFPKPLKLGPRAIRFSVLELRSYEAARRKESAQVRNEADGVDEEG